VSLEDGTAGRPRLAVARYHNPARCDTGDERSRPAPRAGTVRP
jgi:hypothetical protein